MMDAYSLFRRDRQGRQRVGVGSRSVALHVLEEVECTELQLAMAQLRASG